MQEKLFALSDAFWNAMKNRDGETMYAIADPNCNFVQFHRYIFKFRYRRHIVPLPVRPVLRSAVVLTAAQSCHNPGCAL